MLGSVRQRHEDWTEWPPGYLYGTIDDICPGRHDLVSIFGNL